MPERMKKLQLLNSMGHSKSLESFQNLKNILQDEVDYFQRGNLRLGNKILYKEVLKLVLQKNIKGDISFINLL